VDQIHQIPGRFLLYSKENDAWVEVDNDKAAAKTSQALREGAPAIREMAAEKGKTGKKTKGKEKKTRSTSKTTIETQEPHAAADEKSQHPLITAMANGQRGKELVRRSEDPHPVITAMSNGHRGKELKSYPAESHPIITAMANGHRGKQLTPRPYAQKKEPEEVQEQKRSLTEVEQGQNTLVSPETPYSFKRRKIVIDAQAQTPPPALTSTPGQHVEPFFLSDPDPSSNVNGEEPPLPPLTIQRVVNVGDPEAYPTMPLPPRTLSRAHSLASSDINAANDSFTGSEQFVNPFVNEADMLSLGKEDTAASDPNTEHTTDTFAPLNGTAAHPPTSPHQLHRRQSSGTTECSLWSDCLAASDADDGTNFYKQVRDIHDITHPDITTLGSGGGGDDSLPTFMSPYRGKKTETRLVSREGSPNHLMFSF
jgi:hypothetical protein